MRQKVDKEFNSQILSKKTQSVYNSHRFLMSFPKEKEQIIEKKRKRCVYLNKRVCRPRFN